MADAWRRKSYYRPRVLIDVGRLLTPQYDDALVCITGAQLEMLRNLTQYLHRRSTFVAENQEGYYLVADNDDWDTIQGIVADLEETLMGCEEFTALFEAMLVQLECICENQSQTPENLGTIPELIEEYLDNGTVINDDPYPADTEVSARRCAVAQLTYWQAYEWLTEIIQPLQENSMDVVVPMALGVIAVMVGATPFAIPAGALVVFLSLLIDAWIDGSLEAVRNVVWANRDELTCAVYAGLTYDYRTAETRASEVIETMTSLSAVDRLLMRAMFSPWAMALASKAYTQATDWALANVSAGACDDCEFVDEWIWTFPPCPGTWTGAFPCYLDRYPGINVNEDGYSASFTIESITSNIDVEIECKYSSKFGTGWTVGYVLVEYQDAALDWNTLHILQCTTSQAAGAVNTSLLTTLDKAIDRNVLRVSISGQAGQGDTDPYPFMPKYIRVKIVPHV